ncbi:hypothetical protein A3F38_00075 [Candidatus Saccharibacteria bacterium RIFCSPHIGHO2_12_FULL_48_21]|nr:MAG: hypothetical protein A3F38_00075 [Candidatus Saccharibacteria bacterium RIFCSPHIGHO2_12_FULL_48_21]
MVPSSSFSKNQIFSHFVGKVWQTAGLRFFLDWLTCQSKTTAKRAWSLEATFEHTFGRSSCFVDARHQE